uniref:DUF19 domain-containing protein n=1 Tax=Trichuris muris TaxID=70415 RepID=A0A5S6QQL3_TRIMR
MLLSKLVFIGMVILSADAHRCPAEATARINACTGPVERAIDAMISSELFRQNGDSHLHAIYDRKVNSFQELCREVWTFESCVRSVEHLCSEHKTLKFIQESYGYLCSEEYADFLNYLDCIVRVENGKDDCVKKATMETITYRNGTSSQSSNEAACRLLNEFLSCLQAPIEALCGSHAWMLVEKFFDGPRRILLVDCKRRKNDEGHLRSNNEKRRSANGAISISGFVTHFNPLGLLTVWISDLVAPLWPAILLIFAHPC